MTDLLGIIVSESLAGVRRPESSSGKWQTLGVRNGGNVVTLEFVEVRMNVGLKVLSSELGLRQNLKTVVKGIEIEIDMVVIMDKDRGVKEIFGMDKLTLKAWSPRRS